MILGNPWGLLALLAIPAILAIHVFRRRFRPIVVTGLFLYGAPVLAPVAGRQREHLRRRASLLFEILAALAATWFLIDPHFADRDQGQHHVFLLDSRRSLMAIQPDGKTCAEHIRSALQDHLSSLPTDDRVTLVQSGTPPRLLVGPAEQPNVAMLALANWHPDHGWHSLDDSVSLALGLASGGTVTVVSDRDPGHLPPEIALLAAGQPRATAGIADARWLRDAEGERVAIRLLAQGGQAERQVVVRDSTGKELLRRAVVLQDRDPELLTIPIPASISENSSLQIALLGEDAYPLDDEVLLQRPSARVIAWRVDLPEGRARDAVRRALASIPGTREDTAAAHIIIGEDPTPEVGRWTVSVRAGDADPVLGPFLARRGDPLLSDIDATGVLWSGGTHQDSGEALLLAGDTLLVTATRDGRDRRIHLWLDVDHSTLADHPAWPAWFANLIADRRHLLPGIADPNVACGQALRLVLPPQSDRVTITAPDGSTTELHTDAQGIVIHPGLDQAGAHSISLWRGDEQRAWGSLNALALDARLADLSAATLLNRPADNRHATSTIERERGPLALLLPIVVLAAGALFAWHRFRREEAL
jgi:hypothetical protein